MPIPRMPIQRLPISPKLTTPKNTPGNGAANPNAHSANGVTTKVQQLRLATGELMWALATGVEPIPGSEKSKIMYKVLGPVVPGQPPPTIIIRPTAAPGAGTTTIKPTAPITYPPSTRQRAPITPMRAHTPPTSSVYNSQLRMRRETPVLLSSSHPPQLQSRLKSQLLGHSNGNSG